MYNKFYVGTQIVRVTTRNFLSCDKSGKGMPLLEKDHVLYESQHKNDCDIRQKDILHFVWTYLQVVKPNIFSDGWIHH